MSADDPIKSISCTAEDIETWEQPEQKRPDGCGHVWHWVDGERRCKGCACEEPVADTPTVITGSPKYPILEPEGT